MRVGFFMVLDLPGFKDLEGLEIDKITPVIEFPFRFRRILVI